MFHLMEGHRLVERFERHQIDHGPIAFVCGWVRISFLGDFGHSYDLFLFDAMVKADEVPLVHGAEIVSGLVISDPIPHRAAFADKLIPTVSLGFLFHQPMLFGHIPTESILCGSTQSIG